MRKMKTMLIIAASLILVGVILFVGVMFALKWDFRKLSTNEYETVTYDINDKFSNISVNIATSDITFTLAKDDVCRVECYQEKETKYSVYVEDGTLVIKEDSSKQWYQYIGIDFDSPKITVYLPKAEYGSLKVSLSTGDVNISNANCKNIILSGSTGDVILNNTVASDKIDIKRSTGDVMFNYCDADEIFVKTNTGDVTGTLLTDKVFTVKTNTGDIEVPHTTKGGKCKILTNTGDVEITVK